MRYSGPGSKAFLTVLASSSILISALSARPARAQEASALASPPDSTAVSIERSSQLLRDYDSLVVKSFISPMLSVTGSYFATRDGISTQKYVGVGVDGMVGDYGISGIVSAPQGGDRTTAGDTLASLRIMRESDNPSGQTMLSLQLTGSKDVRFARFSLTKNAWSGTVFAGQNTTFSTKMETPDLLTPLPISKILGIDTLADTQVAENTVEKTVAGVSVGYAGHRSFASLLIRQGTQANAYMPDLKFNALETRFSYRGDHLSGRFEGDLRKTAATDYSDALYEGRALFEAKRDGSRVNFGVGGYVNGSGASLSDIVTYNSSWGTGVSVEARIGSRWVGSDIFVDKEGLDDRTVGRFALTLRDGMSRYEVGIRKETTNSSDTPYRTNGLFVGYRGPIDCRLSVDGTFGMQAGKPYGNVSIGYKR